MFIIFAFGCFSIAALFWVSLVAGFECFTIPGKLDWFGWWLFCAEVARVWLSATVAVGWLSDIGTLDWFPINAIFNWFPICSPFPPAADLAPIIAII